MKWSKTNLEKVKDKAFKKMSYYRHKAFSYDSHSYWFAYYDAFASKYFNIVNYLNSRMEA